MSVATQQFDKTEFQKELNRYTRWQSRIEEVKVDFADEPYTVKMMTQRFEMCLNMSGHNIVNMAQRDPDAAREAAAELDLDIEF
jgi:hypothetical protein